MTNRKSIINQYKDTATYWLSTPNKIISLINKYGIPREDYAIYLINNFHKGAKQNFLDLGSGSGNMCGLAQKQFKSIIWLDINKNLIQKSKKIHKNIIFQEHDLNESLPFQDEYFSCITSLVSLDRISNLNSILEETYRVLQKDGTFILEVNNLAFIQRRIQLLFGQYPKASAFSKNNRKDIWRDASVAHLFTKKELSIFLTKFGFKIKKVSGTGMFYKLRNRRPSLLCGDLFFVLTK